MMPEPIRLVIDTNGHLWREHLPTTYRCETCGIVWPKDDSDMPPVGPCHVSENDGISAGPDDAGTLSE